LRATMQQWRMGRDQNAALLGAACEDGVTGRPTAMYKWGPGNPSYCGAADQRRKP
jgi:hypothetical protein